jgi:hypothetical protein
MKRILAAKQFPASAQKETELPGVRSQTAVWEREKTRKKPAWNKTFFKFQPQ